MVDVGALHHHHLFLHPVTADGMTNGGVRLVTVHTFEFHRLTVDVEISAGETELIILGFGVLDLDFAETHIGRYCLHDFALGILKLRHKHIAPGLLGAPLFRVGYFQCRCNLLLRSFVDGDRWGREFGSGNRLIVIAVQSA